MPVINTSLKSAPAFPIEATLDQILSPARKFADSYGLRPFTIIAVRNADRKNKEPINTVEQSIPGSNAIIFAVRKSFTRQSIDDFISDIARTRRVTKSSLLGHKAQLEESMLSSNSQGQKWAAKQARLGINILFATAKASGISVREDVDADRDLLEKNLDLSAKGLQILSVVQLGQRMPKPIS